MSKLALYIFAFALMGSAAYADAPTTQIFYSTKAVDNATGELVYTEKHVYLTSGQVPQSATVHYFGPDGALLAEKTLDFRGSSVGPFFVRANKQTGYREGYELVGDSDPDKGRLFQQQADGERSCDDVVALRPGLIVDAGFNVHLQNNMKMLAAGEALTFDLLIPKACRAIEFAATAQLKKGGLLVSLKPTSFLARLVVPNTEILYDPDTKYLLEYNGLSDLTDAAGRSMKVSIYFEDPVIKQDSKPISAGQGQDGIYGKHNNITQPPSDGAR